MRSIIRVNNPKYMQKDKGKSLALNAGEPLLCDRPMGQHAGVPCALSLVDQRSRMSGLSVYRREGQIWRPREGVANAKSGYFTAFWDVLAK
jgi:hypothetical protein